MMMDGKLVGIAFQSLIGAENTGYIIPLPVVRQGTAFQGCEYRVASALVSCRVLSSTQFALLVKIPHIPTPT